MGSIAIIPARSGSKGLPDKNIKALGGKPLIAYTIEAAKQAGVFDEIHVSTDSEKYADIAREYGAAVPFLRTDALAKDDITTWDVIRYVIREYEKKGMAYDTIAVLQPTSPLRDAEDIRGACEFFKKKGANMISSVCEMEHSPLWSNVLPENLSMSDFEREDVCTLPRQKLPTYYRENGAIYIVKKAHLFQEANIYKNGCYAYIMEKTHSIDIDDAHDFCMAEALLSVLNSGGVY